MGQTRYQLKMLNPQRNLRTPTKTELKNNIITLLEQTYLDVILFDCYVQGDGTQKWIDFAMNF